VQYLADGVYELRRGDAYPVLRGDLDQVLDRFLGLPPDPPDPVTKTLEGD
jgi:hypothetical protein